MNRNISFIPFSKPSIGPEEEEAVIRVLKSGWLTTGKEAHAFEQEFATMVGVKHALAVSSCTAGLHLGLESLNIKEDDWVVTTPYTFTATAETIRYLGAHPLFVDIEENSFNIDSKLVEKTLKESRLRIKALLPVHIGGMACDMTALKLLAHQHDLVILEDAAHAFPVMTPKGYVGTMGDIGSFSFYATKSITTGEGGMVVTNNDACYRRMKTMRLHGIDRDVWNRYQTKDSRSWYYEVVEAGFKYNMTDIAAALGRVQLTKAKKFQLRRKSIADKYQKGLSDSDYLQMPPAAGEHAWHLFSIGINRDKLNIDRDQFMRQLSDKGIGTSLHFIPLHIMPYYRNLYGHKAADYPRAFSRYRSSISLPIYPDLSEAQVQYIIQSIKEIGSKFYKKRI